MTTPLVENLPPSASPHGPRPAASLRAIPESSAPGVVSMRAFVLGVLLSGSLAALNAWIENVASVHFVGGIQMPFGAIFSLAFLIVAINGPLKLARRGMPGLGRVAIPLTATELLTIYAMMVFAALVSTPGTDNFFLTGGPALFYFSTRENGWANVFYSHIPAHFAPGWDGHTFQSKVIEPFYLGGLKLSEIPWHAWTEMLIAWGIFALFLYGGLFFTSLLLRKQWIENEALSFPLVQLPLQMVDGGVLHAAPPVREFWASRTMWMGAGLALSFHLLRGLNKYFPLWPQIPSFQGNVFSLTFTETPWNSAGSIGTDFYFGAIGVAYLLTREMSFSFWFFFLFFKFQMVLSTMLGFPTATLPKDTYVGIPTFITWQNYGSWMGMAGLLLWSARGHIGSLWKEVRTGKSSGEPFSARFIFAGLLLSCAGIMGWCWFSGINLFVAVAFFGLYGLTSLVLSRLVVEGGFLFPQASFGPLEMLTGSVIGSSAMGAGTLAKMSFLQPAMFSDMRTNLMPGFLHTLKIAYDLKLDHRQTRRIMGCAVAAIILAWCVSTFTTITTIYSSGGLAGYSWFTQSGPVNSFTSTATMMNQQPGIAASNWGWLLTGVLIVWCLTFARSRFMWFPLHPLGYLASCSYPITKLWLSFFIGWAVKSLLLRFGGQDSANKFRPFMIGLILGNAAAMVLWMIYGFFAGTQISYWPA